MTKKGINKDLVLRFLNNDCSEAEIDTFTDLVKDTSGDEALKDLLFDVWSEESSKEQYTDVDFDALLEKIHHHIITQQLRNPIFNQQKVAKANFIRTLYIKASRIAAILFIPLMVYTLINWYSSKTERSGGASYAEMQTPQGVTTNITLPDGTEVWLNSDSWIKYPQNFIGKERNVEFKGEGYFKVAHNAEVPFVVKTDEINIKVLGTEFNIENYNNQKSIKATLVKGKVELQKISKEGKVKTITNLHPNEQLQYNKQNQKSILYKDVATYKYTAWLEGKTVFENDPLDEVMDRLARKYNVDVDFNGDALAKYSFTATFENENFEQVIALIKLAIPINYSLEDSIKMNDNTFTRKRYVIKLRNI